MTLEDLIQCLAGLTTDGLIICALPHAETSTFYDQLPRGNNRCPMPAEYMSAEYMSADAPGPIIVWSNTVAGEILGQGTERLQGQALLPLIRPDHQMGLSDALKENPDAAGGDCRGATRLEVPFLHAALGAVWIQVTIGHPPAMPGICVLTIVDVTERKRDDEILEDAIKELSRRADEDARMQEALKESRYYLAVAESASRIGLWDWDLRRQEVVLSKHWFAMLGFQPSDFPDARNVWAQLVHPEDKEAALAQLQAYLAGTTENYEAEFRMRCADGSHKWVHARGEVVERDEGGAPVRIVGTHIDQSTRRFHETRLQNALLEAEQARERLAKLTNNAPGVLFEYVIGKDKRGQFPYLSNGIDELLEISMEDVLADGQVMFNAVLEEDMGIILAELGKSYRELTPFRVEYRIKLPDGGIKWVHSASLPERQPDGSTLWHGYLHDITERKTIELALAQAKNAAEAASKSKSQFLANMSHEIRTPMNGVLGMAAALAKTSLDSDQQRLVSVIREAGDALMTVLNDILDFSKIEANRLTLEKVPFRISDLVAKIENVHALKAREKKIDFNIQRDPTIEDCRLGDPVRILQVLHNLTSNAIKFTEKGAVSITIGADSGLVVGRGACSSSVVFEILDTGIGMTPEQCASVFSEFVQADNSTTRCYGGTGLGLAIVRGLTEAMGGRIILESQFGEGTVFQVHLPLEITDLRPIGETAAAQGVSTMGTGPSALVEATLEKPPRILVAEDNAMNRMVLEALLAPSGADLTFAENGLEAIDMIDTGPFDLVLMDIQMPVMDGVTAMKFIREAQSAGQTPTMCIIALTANVLDSQVRSYRDAGFDTHVAKPIKPEALFDVIEKAVSIRRTAELLEPQVAPSL